MCLVLFAYESHPAYRLVLAGNRDEFYQRPTEVARFWPDNPGLLAGRDLQGGGTWLGVTLEGRIATVTNYRNAGPQIDNAPSRGFLVRDFLLGRESAEDYARAVHRAGADYNGFCFLGADTVDLWYCTNRGEEPRPIAPGIYGLSNHLLDTPWPKVERGKRQLEAVVEEGGEIRPERLLRILADRNRPDDPALPDTGIGVARERVLSSIHVSAPGYGTRSSTVVLVDRRDRLRFVERSYSPGGESEGTVEYEFQIQTISAG